MALTFPGNCTTAEDRLAYSCRAKKLLIDVHNVFAVWARDGITQSEYDNGVAASVDDNISQATIIPNKLKALHPYKDGFDVAKMGKFIKDEFKPRHETIALSLTTARAQYEDTKEIDSAWDRDIVIGDISKE